MDRPRDKTFTRFFESISRYSIDNRTKAVPSDITQFAAELGGELPEFHELWKHLRHNSIRMFDTVSIKTAEDQQAMMKWASSLEVLQEVLNRSVAGNTSLQLSILEMKGIREDVDLASQRALKAIDHFNQELAIADSCLATILDTIGQQLETEGG